jgi:hypothetical protein
VTRQTLKVFEISGIVLSATNRADGFPNVSIFPRIDDVVAKDLIDQLNVNQIPIKVKTDLLEKTQIFISSSVSGVFFVLIRRRFGSSVNSRLNRSKAWI